MRCPRNRSAELPKPKFGKLREVSLMFLLWFDEKPEQKWTKKIATSAAPFYFKKLKVDSEEFPDTDVRYGRSIHSEGKKMHFEDGGLVCNDPSLAAVAEAMCLFNYEGKKYPILLLSFGTGIDVFSDKRTPKGYLKLAMRSKEVPFFSIFFSIKACILKTIDPFQLQRSSESNRTSEFPGRRQKLF